MAEPAVAALEDLDFQLRAGNEWELLDILTDVIARTDATAVVAPLGMLLADASPIVRNRAVQALGKLDDVRARRLLESALTDPDGQVRREARAALGKT